jgi:hypothetical protein
MTEFYEYGKEFSISIISGEHFEQPSDYQVASRPLHLIITMKHSTQCYVT